MNSQEQIRPTCRTLKERGWMAGERARVSVSVSPTFLDLCQKHQALTETPVTGYPAHQLPGEPGPEKRREEGRERDRVHILKPSWHGLISESA